MTGVNRIGVMMSAIHASLLGAFGLGHRVHVPDARIPLEDRKHGPGSFLTRSRSRVRFIKKRRGKFHTVECHTADDIRKARAGADMKAVRRLTGGNRTRHALMYARSNIS